MKGKTQMLSSTVENLGNAKSIIMQEIAPLVTGKVSEALEAINTYNIKVEEQAVKAEETLAELDKAAEEETSAFAKMMWPEFRAKKVAEIEAIRASVKTVPGVEELAAYYTEEISVKVMTRLGLQEYTVNTRKPRGGDGAFDGIWGTAMTHSGKNWLVANYRIVPDNVKESAKMLNSNTWALFAQNQQGKWYVAKTFEATSPSGVVLEVIRHSSGNPGLAQTNLALSAWYSNHGESVKKLLTIDAEKLAKNLA